MGSVESCEDGIMGIPLGYNPYWDTSGNLVRKMGGTGGAGGYAGLEGLFGAIENPSLAGVNKGIGALFDQNTGVDPFVRGGLQGFDPFGRAGAGASLDRLISGGARTDVSPIIEAAQNRAQVGFEDFLNQSSESFGALNLGSSSAKDAARAREGARLQQEVANVGMEAQVGANERALDRMIPGLSALLQGSGQSLQGLLGLGGLDMQGKGIRSGNLRSAGQLGLGADELLHRGKTDALRGRQTQQELDYRTGGMLPTTSGGVGKRFGPGPHQGMGASASSGGMYVGSRGGMSSPFSAIGGGGGTKRSFFNEGGEVEGSAPPDMGDTVLAMLTPEELVVPAELAQKIKVGSLKGDQLLKQLQGLFKKDQASVDLATGNAFEGFACGGPVRMAEGGQAGFEKFLLTHGAEHAKNFSERFRTSRNPEEQRRTFRALAVQNLGGEDAAFELYSNPELMRDAMAKGNEFIKSMRGTGVKLPGGLDFTNPLGIGYSRLRTEGKPVREVSDFTIDSNVVAADKKAATKQAREEASAAFDEFQAARLGLLEDRAAQGKRRHAGAGYNIPTAIPGFQEGGQVDEHAALIEFLKQYVLPGEGVQYGPIEDAAPVYNAPEPVFPEIPISSPEFTPGDPGIPNLPVDQPLSLFEERGRQGLSITKDGAELEHLTPGTGSKFGTVREGQGGFSVMGVQDTSSPVEQAQRKAKLAQARVDLYGSFMTEKPTAKMGAMMQAAMKELDIANARVVEAQEAQSQVQTAENNARMAKAAEMNAQANMIRAQKEDPLDQQRRLEVEMTRIAQGQPPYEGAAVPTPEEVAAASRVLGVSATDPKMARMLKDVMATGDPTVINEMFKQLGLNMNARFPEWWEELPIIGKETTNGIIVEPSGELNTESSAMADQLNTIRQTLAAMREQQGAQ